MSKKLALSIAVLSLLIWLMIPVQTVEYEKTPIRKTELALSSLGVALESYRQDVGSYPSNDGGLRQLLTNKEQVNGWAGPYFRDQQVLRDHWENELIYRSVRSCTDSTESFELYSVGKNGIDEHMEGDDITGLKYTRCSN